MDSNAIALIIGAAGVALGIARLAVSILSYRLDSHRAKKSPRSGNSNQKTSVDQ